MQGGATRSSPYKKSGVMHDKDEAAEAIYAMGFDVSRETVVRLLQETGGSMDAAIDRLLSLPAPDSRRAANEEQPKEHAPEASADSIGAGRQADEGTAASDPAGSSVDAGGAENYRLPGAPGEDEDAEMAAMLRSMVLHAVVYMSLAMLARAGSRRGSWVISRL